jgi:hypothetical protein
MGKKLVAKPVCVVDVGNKQRGRCPGAHKYCEHGQEGTSSGDICGAPFLADLVSGAGEDDAQGT